MRPNPVAVELGLDDPNGPAAVLSGIAGAGWELGSSASSHPHEVNGVSINGNSSPPNMVYMYLLDACEKVFDNELDQATFEEHMRWFFGDKVRLSSLPSLTLSLC